LNGDSAADGENTGLRYGDGVSIPSPFWKGLGPRIFCLIFCSQNAYFGEFYGPFEFQTVCEKIISEKIIPCLELKAKHSHAQSFRFRKSTFLQFENQNVEFKKQKSRL